MARSAVLEMHNAFFPMLFLLILAMISPAEAQAVTCDSNSSECCWVVRIWQLMGKTTSVDPTSSTACCSMEGVTCSGSTVTHLYWGSQSLTGSIPSDVGNLVNLQYLGLYNSQLTGSIPVSIGNLVNLQYLDLVSNQLSGSIPDSIGNLVNLLQLILNNNQVTGSIPDSIGNLVNLRGLYLYTNQLSGPIPDSIGNLVNLQLLWLYNNQLSGPIPDSIGNLVNLQDLYIQDNPGLNGTVTPNCGVKVMAANTGISTICGCAASPNIPISMPNADNITRDCLAQTYNTTVHDHFEFGCPVDSNGNPTQSCMNSLAFFCGNEHIQGRPNRIQGCKDAVKDYFSTMSSFWIALRRECGQWAWTDGYIGNASSSTCSSAKLALQQKQNANYTEADNSVVAVSSALINSIQELLWDHPSLQ